EAAARCGLDQFSQRQVIAADACLGSVRAGCSSRGVVFSHRKNRKTRQLAGLFRGVKIADPALHALHVALLRPGPAVSVGHAVAAFAVGLVADAVYAAQVPEETRRRVVQLRVSLKVAMTGVV